jgi:hypothetical protein
MPAITAEPTSQPVVATLTPLAQYRQWMEEARGLHPYPEPVDKMWAVMMCESGGEPMLSASLYHGLFQYHPDTWAGEWNPYRSAAILDPRAQIFATAKAWQEGYQSWWGCYALT